MYQRKANVRNATATPTARRRLTISVYGVEKFLADILTVLGDLSFLRPSFAGVIQRVVVLFLLLDVFEIKVILRVN